MRNSQNIQALPKKTVISIVRDAISAYRRSQRWSRETMTNQVVEAHERIGGNETTGIAFDPLRPGRDEVDRRKVNADRVFRWLDDESKDNNLLPANFLPSLLAAMPVDIRIECVNTMLAPIGLVVTRFGDGAGETELDVITHITGLIKEGAEGQQAFAQLQLDRNPENLHRAHREVSESKDAHVRALAAIEAEMARLAPQEVSH